MRETNIDIRSWPHAHHTIIPLAIIAHTTQPLLDRSSLEFFMEEKQEEIVEECEQTAIQSRDVFSIYVRLSEIF